MLCLEHCQTKSLKNSSKKSTNQENATNSMNMINFIENFEQLLKTLFCRTYRSLAMDLHHSVDVGFGDVS